MKKFALASALLATAALASPASAEIIFTSPSVNPGPVSVPGSVALNVNAPRTTIGQFTFQLLGFLSLDGTNSFQDDFALNVNGTDVLTLSYDLGGGGGNVIFTQPTGTTVTGGATGFFQGGTLNVSLPVALVQGVNSIMFNYTAPGVNNGGGQPIGDEGFGIGSATLTGAVPEPETWAMLILGFGLVGSTLRRRAKAGLAHA